MNNRHIYVLSAVLALIGLALFAYKAHVLGFPLQPQEQTQVWTIEAAVRFDPGPAAVKATLRIPTLTPGFSILDENFISRGFGHATRSAPMGRESQCEFSLHAPPEEPSRLGLPGAVSSADGHRDRGVLMGGQCAL